MWYSVRNLANKVVEIDIEGVIGGGWFSDNNITMEQVNKDLKDLKPLILAKNAKSKERVIKEIEDYFITLSDKYLHQIFK